MFFFSVPAWQCAPCSRSTGEGKEKERRERRGRRVGEEKGRTRRGEGKERLLLLNAFFLVRLQTVAAADPSGLSLGTEVDFTSWLQSLVCFLLPFALLARVRVCVEQPSPSCPFLLPHPTFHATQDLDGCASLTPSSSGYYFVNNATVGASLAKCDLGEAPLRA